jgi:serine O-acetyltransferase
MNVKSWKRKLNPFDATRLAVRNTRISRFINRFVNNCQIHKSARIGKSFKLSHCGASTVIGKKVKIGNNVHIYHNVTIGAERKYSDEYPVIESNVIIYPGSIIIGNVNIGKNSIIGAHSFVNKDVPPNSIVYTDCKLIIKGNSNL